MALPKFVFKDSSIQNDVDLDQALADDVKKESKVVKPGNYGVTIKKVEVKGQSEKARTWTKLALELEVAGGNTIKTTILVPTETIFFGADKSTFLFTKIKKFCAALGEDLSISTWTAVLSKLFAKPEKLAGQALNIDVGYANAYPEWAGKQGDQVSFRLKLKDGSVVHENGAPKLFTAATSKEASDAVASYCAANSIKFDAFPQVLAFNPGAPTAAEQPGW